ncbi:MAG TPA: CAP domain-containing protein [Mycobacteriales bacterium]|nr:CAP domain-containing protein [Mycobacteriales bacterium]
MRLPSRPPARFALPATISLVVALLAALLPSTASADTTTEGQFVSDTNQARAQDGLHAYAVRSDLTTVARRWAAYMAQHQTLAHNPNYQNQVCCWTEIGENVGEGSSVGQIQRAFMASAPHRDNILSRDFTQVGIGTAHDSAGRLYVDELFRRPSGSQAAQAPVAPVSAPAPSVPVQVAVHRASRSAHRAGLAPRRHPAAPPSATTLLSERLATATQESARQPRADPVMGAWTFVQVMAELSGSPGH